jgi:N-acylneuraminate cytidylyltransferase
MSGERILPFEIDPSYACDIDTEHDWHAAESRLARLPFPVIRPSLFPNPVRLVVFDFDGVLTDNRVWVSETGSESVACDRSDGLSFGRLRALGIGILVLSTETNPVVSARCLKLGVDCVQGVTAKGLRLREWLADRSIDPAHVVYVGNDVNDLECLQLSGCGVAVCDAYPEAIAAARVVLTRRGGRGAVRELCDLIEAHVRSRVRS